MTTTRPFRALLFALDESLAQLETYYAQGREAAIRGPLLRRRRAVSQLQTSVPLEQRLRPPPQSCKALTLDTLIESERALVLRYQDALADETIDAEGRDLLQLQNSEVEQALLSLMLLKNSS
jgi:hypothetical protein